MYLARKTFRRKNIFRSQNIFFLFKLGRPFGDEIFRRKDFWRSGIQFHRQMS